MNIVARPAPAPAIQLHWAGGATDLTVSQDTQALLVVLADSAEVTLPNTWRLQWTADSSGVGFSAFDPSSACLVDTAKVDSIALPATAADSAANEITARFCSAGSGGAANAYFLVDLVGGGKGKMRVLASDPADSTVSIESNVATYNGGISDEFGPTLLQVDRTHIGSEYVATVAGLGLASVDEVTVRSPSAMWSARLNIVEQSDTSLTAVGQIAAPLPEVLLQVSGAAGVALSTPLAADELLAPPAAPPYAKYVDASTYVRPKDFAFFYDGMGKFHLFYIRHNTSYSDCNSQRDLNEKKFAHVSGDLYAWSAQDTSFAVSSNTWDQAHVWAPTIVQAYGTYYMFYTGVDLAGNETIGFATTDNINVSPISWTRQANPVFTTNSTHNLWGYQPGGVQHCRDPFIMPDPTDNTRWLMYYTANLAVMPDWQTIGVARSAQNSLTSWVDIGPMSEISYLHNYSYTSESPHVIPHVNANGTTSWWIFDTSDYAIMANRNAGGPADTTETYGPNNWDLIANRLYQHLTHNDPRVQYWNGSEYLKVSTQEYLAGYNAAVGPCGVVTNPDSNAIWIAELQWTSGTGTSPDVFGLAAGVTTVEGQATPASQPFGLRLADVLPGSGQVTFGVSLPARMLVQLEIYDVLGRKVRAFLRAELPAGTTRAVWDGRDRNGRAVGSGIYFACLSGSAGSRAVRVPLFR